jgi:hypothetical protein
MPRPIDLVLSALLLTAAPALPQPVSLSLQAGSGAVLAERHASASKGSVTLQLDRELQPEDRIVATGPQWITLRISNDVAPCSIYLSAAANQRFEFPIPFGAGEKNTGSAYSPEAFRGTSQVISATPLSKADRRTRRNLALNPCDQRTDTPTAFPHASTNSVSREAYNFDARNAIDGVTQNGHHGEWPYQSWGPLIKDDIWWQLDFGRDVELDTLRLMLRTDFPHDSYWKSAVVEFSDGTTLPITMTGDSGFQDFHFPAHTVRSFKLTRLVSAEQRWSGLMEVEAWGRDLR